MLRTAAIAALAALLTGCWGAEIPLFGARDWVQPAGLEGPFVSEDAAGEDKGTVLLTRRPDGLIDGAVTRAGETSARTSAIGFVAIPGGSGHYFLMVNRAAEGAPDTRSGGEFYLIGRWKDERLEAFWPQCTGTPDMPGMERERIEIVDEAVCRFADKGAVLRAALLAERELETKRMFEHQLLGRLKRPEATAAPEPDD